MASYSQNLIDKNKAVVLCSSILMCNFILYAFTNSLSIERSLIVYEYLFCMILLAYNINRYIIIAAMTGTMLLDITQTIINIYFLSPNDILDYMKYISFYKPKQTQLKLLLILTISLSPLYIIIKYQISQKDFFLIKKIAISLTFLTFCLDWCNGSNKLSIFKPGLLGARNIAHSNLGAIYSFIKNSVEKEDKNIRIIPSSSTAFKLLKSDSTGNQLLVIIESFGKIQNDSIYQLLKNTLTEKFEANGWHTLWGETMFKGSTTSAEIRELLNAEGSYTELLSRKKSDNLISLIKIKNTQGYYTIAAHPYTKQMFAREIFWKNIGIQQTFFQEDILLKSPKLEINKESPFEGVNDEDAFDFLQSHTVNQKTFGYFLTLNTHLPFIQDEKRKKIDESALFIENLSNISIEAKQQLSRIFAIITHITKKTSKEKWDKILIIGDHAPPFINSRDRHFYSKSKVPYIFLYQ